MLPPAGTISPHLSLSSASSCPFHGGHSEEPHDHHDHAGTGTAAAAEAALRIPIMSITTTTITAARSSGCSRRNWPRRRISSSASSATTTTATTITTDHHHHHGDFQPETSPMGVWLKAMGCSLLVNMASLVFLILLPVIFFQGKPSKAMMDALAVFAYLYTGKLRLVPHDVVSCADPVCPHGSCLPSIRFAVELMYAAWTFKIPELMLVFQPHSGGA